MTSCAAHVVPSGVHEFPIPVTQWSIFLADIERDRETGDKEDDREGGRENRVPRNGRRNTNQRH